MSAYLSTPYTSGNFRTLGEHRNGERYHLSSQGVDTPEEKDDVSDCLQVFTLPVTSHDHIKSNCSGLISNLPGFLHLV